MEGQFLEVQGMRVHCLHAGEKGPVVVLLHGLGASSIAWRETVGPLSADYRVYAPDLPGHGESDKPPIRYTLEEGVQFVEGLLDTIGAERAALVGNSMGGAVALKTALERPHRVSHLVLVDSAGLGREVALFVRLASLPLVGEVLERPRIAWARALLKNIFYDPRSIPDGLVEELYRLRRMPGSKEAVLRALRWGVDLWGVKGRAILLRDLPRLQVPTLIVWGAQDRILPLAHAYEAVRRLPSARLVVLDRCGHWPQVERAGEFLALLREFLGGPPALDPSPAPG